MVPTDCGRSEKRAMPAADVDCTTETPGPLARTCAPATGLPPLVTLTLNTVRVVESSIRPGAPLMVLQTVGGVNGAVAGALTVTVACALLFAVFVSGELVLTVAVFTIVPGVVARTSTWIEADAPAARLPSEHSTGPVPEQLPVEGTAEMNVMPEGRSSATTTSAAVAGPAFETLSV